MEEYRLLGEEGDGRLRRKLDQFGDLLGLDRMHQCGQAGSTDGSMLGGEGDCTLPRQEDGLSEAVVEDSSGWMVSGSMDSLRVLSGMMGCLFIIGGSSTHH